MKNGWLVLAVLLVTACGPDVTLGSLAGESPGEDVESISESTGAIIPAVQLNVSWNYVDFIGRVQEANLQVPGSVNVTFLGNALPLAGESTTLQSARVVFLLPSFLNPRTQVRREFLVRFETSDGGKTFLATGTYGPFGRNSIIDASLSNATSLFNSTYNATTQKAFPRTALGSDLLSVVMTLNRQVGGGYLATARLSAPTTTRSDFARHTTSILLK